MTHADHRGNGYAGECLDYAKKIVEQENCYKMNGGKYERSFTFEGEEARKAIKCILWMPKEY